MCLTISFQNLNVFALAMGEHIGEPMTNDKARLLITKIDDLSICFMLSSFFAGLKPQTGVAESFFDENVELSTLRNQVSELQLSQDSLQEQVTSKNDKIKMLVSNATFGK